MKILKYSFLLALVFAFAACSEKDRAFTEYDDLGHGAYGRLLDGVNGILDFEDPATSTLDWTVEFYDDQQGQLVESFVWTASFPGFDPAVIATRNRADFTTNPDTGLPTTSYSVTYQQVLDALGMTLDDIILGEQYDFQGTITLSDGRTFSSSNTGSNVVSSSPFSGFFQFRQGIENLPCIHALSGTFDAVAKSISVEAGIGWDDCDGNEWTGQVRWEAEHDETEFGAGTYNVFSTDPTLGTEFNDLSFGAYYPCYGSTAEGSLPNGEGAGDVRINFDCNKGFFSGSSQWGEVFEFLSMEASGSDLTITWRNDYGEAGEVVLSRTDGNEWPTDMRI